MNEFENLSYLGIPFEHLTTAEKGRCLRQARIRAAREKGTHTKAEWTALFDVFGCCVACGIPFAELNGGQPTKDHIIPICIEGCDCIANIQPLCRNCNSLKRDLIDHRPLRRADWARAFTARLAYGWTS